MATLVDLLQSMANFTWALTSFGLSQSGKVLRDLTTDASHPTATRSFDDATAVLANLTSSFLQPGSAVIPGAAATPGAAASRAALARDLVLVPSFVEFPADVRGEYFEEVFSVYNVGRGVFDETTSYINLQVEMFNFNGQWAGLQTGVHVNITPPPELPPKLVAVPPPPPLPIDAPPVPHPEVAEWTKGLFTFADGSAILAQGPAWTHLVPLKDGAFLFMVTTAQVITHGTGLYEGLQGIKQGTGTTYVAPGLVQSGKFPAPGFVFTAKVIDTFRLLRKGFQNSPAISGRGAGTEPGWRTP
jgi:hypothetical protein